MRGVWFWRHGGGIGYASTASSKVACFEYARGAWRENTTPEGRGLAGVAGGPGPVVGVLTQAGGGFAGVFAKTHYSTDCGARWVETDSPYDVKASAPIVMPYGHVLEAGGVFGDRGIYRSVDRGKTWQKITDDAVVFDNNLWVLPTVGMLSVSRGQYGFELVRQSSDEGKTWTTEVSSINRELLKETDPLGKNNK